MTNKRFSNLPSVLAEYDPEFYAAEQNDGGESQNKKTPRQSKENKVKRNEGKKTPRPGEALRAKSTTPSDRMTPTSRHRKKRDEDEEERLEQVANLWDQVKLEFQQERHEILEEKVRLQHKLIRAQDIRAQKIRQRQERAEEKERTEKRRAKQEAVAALQGRSSADSKASSRKSKAKDEEPVSDNAEDSEVPSSPSTESSGHRKERVRHAHHHGYLPSESYVPAASPMKEQLNEEEEEDDDKQPRAPDGVVTPADLNSVPWHHAQLYKMYGRHADYYIHPKMQPEKKKIVNPTLKSQKGHLGASHIWTTLRKDSMNKLHNTDRRFPQELKDAFSSHVREGITNHKKPVYRNFTVTDDVPDLNRLMDQSLLRKIRVLRHKTELMYRSSQTNNDRTKVLLFNSPLPAVSEGDEGIEKYLPSWDMSREEAESQLSYTKWLKKGEDAEPPYNDTLESTEISVGDEGAPKRERRLHPTSTLTPLGSEYSESLHSIWDAVMMRQRPRQQPKYHFLTEEEAATPGAFLEKLGLNKNKLDLGRIDLLQESQNLTGRSSLPSLKALSAPQSRSSRHSVSGPVTGMEDKGRYETRWQPLSLNALIEYKEQMGTQGEGDFHQGRPTMWKAGLAASVD